MLSMNIIQNKYVNIQNVFLKQPNSILKNIPYILITGSKTHIYIVGKKKTNGTCIVLKNI